jgi:hypothetical protein
MVTNGTLFFGALAALFPVGCHCFARTEVNPISAPEPEPESAESSA